MARPHTTILDAKPAKLPDHNLITGAEGIAAALEWLLPMSASNAPIRRGRLREDLCVKTWAAEMQPHFLARSKIVAVHLRCPAQTDNPGEFWCRKQDS